MLYFKTKMLIEILNNLLMLYKIILCKNQKLIIFF
jgi:hypothetical protein